MQAEVLRWWGSLFTYSDIGGPSFEAGTGLVDSQIGFLEWFIKMAQRDIESAGNIIEELKTDREEQMPRITMAKSSPEEMKKMLQFFSGLEAIFEGEFDEFEVNLEDAVSEYVVKWWDEFLDASWQRFYWGFDTLLSSAADPDLDYLDWKPEIKAILDAHEATPRKGEDDVV